MRAVANLLPPDAALLRDIVARRDPTLLPTIDTLGTQRLAVNQREDIRSVLVDEICETGLRPDGEPNERGRVLDDLIGRLAAL